MLHTFFRGHIAYREAILGLLTVLLPIKRLIMQQGNSETFRKEASSVPSSISASVRHGDQGW